MSMTPLGKDSEPMPACYDQALRSGQVESQAFNNLCIYWPIPVVPVVRGLNVGGSNESLDESLEY